MEKHLKNSFVSWPRDLKLVFTFDLCFYTIVDVDFLLYILIKKRYENKLLPFVFGEYRHNILA